MIVLHLHWIPSTEPGHPPTMQVWGETSAPLARQTRSRKNPLLAHYHPFSLPASDLHTLFITLFHIRPISDARRTLWLPSDTDRPLPSPDLAQPQAGGDTPPPLRPWKLPCLQLTPEQTFDLLTWLHQNELPADLRAGPGTRYWHTVGSFLLEILARQLCRPTLRDPQQTGTPHYQARWYPVLDSEQDAVRAARLAAAMPPVCRADTPHPDRPLAPRPILDSFLTTLTDTAMRHALIRQGRPFSTGPTPADGWLAALGTHSANILLPNAQLVHFAALLRGWERALTIAGDKYIRVALRLEAPGQRPEGQDSAAGSVPDTTWQLHYLLQARDDASLIVSADELWNPSSKALHILDQRFKRPQEQLLTGLGYAAKLFGPIRDSLQQPNPTGVTLSADQAYAFLRECAPRLQEAGFGLLTPPWWNKPGTRLGVRLQLGHSAGPGQGAVVSSGHMALENLVSYHWALAVGETTLTQSEFDALVALKSPLVQIRGQWVQLDPEQIEAAIRFWKGQKAAGTVTMAEALKMGLEGSGRKHNGLDVDHVSMDGWLQSRINQLQGDEKLSVLPVPAGIRATLRPYQEYGWSWLAFARRCGLGTILADDMGLGKTVQALTLIEQLRAEAGGQLPGPVLLICPTSVVTNWELERQKFAPELRALVHQGSDRLREAALIAEVQNHDLVLTSYALMRRDGEALQQIAWYGVILDEAQNIKNAGTRQAQHIRRLSADFRIALTGTPIENRLSELWSIMHFLNPGFLGSRERFHREFALPIEKYNDENAATRLRQLVRPFLLRRVKTDPTVIQDLPDKQEVRVYCQLSAEQATLYEAVVRDGLSAVAAQQEGLGRKGLVLSMLMQLKQICNHPAQYLHEHAGYDPAVDIGRSGKLARFDDLLEEILAEGSRLLVFSQFTEMAGLLQTHIRSRFGVPTLYLHGGVPGTKRAALVEQFQREDGPPVFLLSLKAGGTGLNLTRANHVFHFDRWWNPAVEDQATDRAFRIGQKRNVLVHKFVCLGTLEEQIDKMIEEKKALAESVVGSGEGWLTEMSTEALRQLVQLRQAASEEEG